MSQHRFGHRTGTSRLLASVLIANAGWALPAAAQDQNTASSDASLEEVLVTATKRSERLVDVPVSISVLGASSLENQQAVKLQDYFAQVPGLQVNPSSSGRLSIAMRGITTGGSTNPTVGITIDDVPVGSSSSLTYAGLMAADIDPATLQSIEVLRGPQGTLYGAASLGGLLRYVTAKPRMNELSGRYQVEGSSVANGEEGYGVRGNANIPLVDDKLAATVSGFYRHDPGVIDNRALGRSDVDSADVWGARASTLWQISDAVSLRLSATYQATDGDGSSSILSTTTRDASDGFTQEYIRGSGSYERRAQQYDATLSVAFGWADLTAISGYGVNEFEELSDVSQPFGGLTELATGRTDLGSITRLTTDTDKFSQEIRLASPTGETLEWLVGVFYTKEDSDAHYDIYGSDLETGALVTPVFPDAFPTTFEEEAVFGSLTYHFTDRFDVQLGARASRNEQEYEETITGPLYDPPYFVTADSKDDSVTYLFSPRFRIAPNAMVYGRVATGYRPGGPNPGAGFGTPAEYDADTTVSYEVGLKGEFFDRSVSLDTSVYYIDWQDIQLQQRDPVTEFVYYTNAGSARSRGIDITAQATATDGLTLVGTLSYNDAELQEPTNGGIYALAGDRLPFSADVSGSLSADQEFPIGASMMGFVGGTLTYLGERSGNFAPSAGVVRPELPSYTTVDLRGGVRFQGWTITAFAKNLTDERGVLGASNELASGASGRYLLQMIRPRTIGLSLAKSF